MPSVTDPAAVSKPGIYLVERPNSVQTNLIVGVQAIRRTDPDYFGLAVMNKVIGGGPTGRLFRNLARGQGLHLRCRVERSTRRGFAAPGSPTRTCAPK